jgi:hypothetical protein
MLVSYRTKGKERKRRVRGMVKAAKHLGISRMYLYDVIHGHRRSAWIEEWLKDNLTVLPDAEEEENR